MHNQLSRQRVRVVREDVAGYGAYEREGSERRALGSIAVDQGARWLATLTVPIPDDRVLFIHLERQGDLPPGYRGGEESADFSLPAGEVDAVMALFAGLVNQARRDGVIPDGGAPPRAGS